MAQSTPARRAALAVLSLWLGSVVPAQATPRAAIEVIEILAPGNPESITVRDGTFSTDIKLGVEADNITKPTDQAALNSLKLGDELAAAMQKALEAKGIKAYIAGTDPHPWPTASLQLSIDDARYERRLEENRIGPNLLIRFRLYDASSRDRLSSDSYVYDMYAKTIGRNIVRPPEEFGFEKREELQAKPGVILAAMRKGIDEIAQEIVKDILADVEE